MVRDEMMHVVTALPPSYREPAAQVGNNHPDQRVDNVIVGYSSMTSVMGGKHDLVLYKVSKMSLLNASGCVERTQKRPRKQAEVMIQPALKLTMNSAKIPAYRNDSLAYSL